MKLEFFISLRYFLAKKRRTSISLISAISIGCVALAVLVLIVVFSVMNGFHQSIKSKILANEAHVVVTPSGTHRLMDYRQLAERIAAMPRVRSALPFYEGQGMLGNGATMRGIKVRGVVEDLPARDADFREKFKMVGEFDLTRRNNIVIGEVLAGLMMIAVGDIVSIYVPPDPNSSEFLVPLNMQYRVTGIFSSGFGEYDEFMVFMSMRDAQLLYGVGDLAYGIGVKIDDFTQADAFKKDLDRTLDYNYLTATWTFLRRNFYQALGTEKILVGVVLFFLTVMAAFSIASTLIMVVMEKEREIGILKSIGMQTALIMRVFIVQGFIIGMVGTLIGLFTGLFIASAMHNLLQLLEDAINLFRNGYHAVFGTLFSLPTPHPWKLFPQDVYYVTTFPVEIDMVEVYAICLCSVLLTTLCAFIPANQAARLKVTEVLHKE